MSHRAIYHTVTENRGHHEPEVRAIAAFEKGNIFNKRTAGYSHGSAGMCKLARYVLAGAAQRVTDELGGSQKPDQSF